VRRRWVLLGIAAVLVPAIAFGLYWFQPWKLWTDHRVNDALPAVATQPVPVGEAHRTATPVPTPTSAASQQPVLLARGMFISHEHHTSGTASIVRQPDGSRVLAIANLDTSQGPLVKVWLTEQKVSKDGWHVFDDGKYVDLGSLKGNLGNQLYPIPHDADLSQLQSVTIWCDRFDVSFGAAELVPVT
jgi:Electron transfer DM13